ncbi:HigA family addiction module antitoxin [Burkholderia cenocepacia]
MSNSTTPGAMRNHPHPGELLHEDVFRSLGLDVAGAAQQLGVSRSVLSRVLDGHAGIGPNLATHLEHAGFTTARFWLAVQRNYELSQSAPGEQQ